MPQMSPVMWTTMMMITTIMIYQMNSMMFFNKKKLSKDKLKKMKKNTNWKW
uniref:ATP synthase F0 subunit 8 n=1 Tax=Kodaianella bicinctifrons TaxID=1201171 RepID=UPI002A7F3CDD|nr:ATP synthase F0 subunit 8 [Kodaianella bicinctifrons]WOW98882.1 ATP synthase F0 subunit 8 [Kodaianella bicinctifrons]